MPRYSVSTTELVELYEQKLMTMQEIADLHGMTKQAVYHRLKKVAKSRFKALKVPRVCRGCRESFTANRWRIRNGGGAFCSTRCYHESVSIGGMYSRQGQRAGRLVCGAQVGEVVHHIDGDTMNNEPWNLVVFGSNAAHMSFHKSGRASALKSVLPQYGEPSWSGPHREGWALEMTGSSP